MKNLLYLILLFSISTKAQIYEVLVDTKHQTIYSEKGLEFFNEIKDVDARKWNIEQNSNPPVLNFKIIADKNNLNILELDKINNSQENTGSIKKSVPNLPFGFSAVNYKDAFALRPVDVYGKKYIEKAELKELDWKIENEFKEILGYKVQKATSKYQNFDVIIWFTKDIKPNFMPAYNIKPIDGFVLEMQYVIENESGKMLNTIYVTSLKEIKKYTFKSPIAELGKKNNIVSSDELDKIYEEANKKRNEMYNQDNGVDKK